MTAALQIGSPITGPSADSARNASGFDEIFASSLVQTSSRIRVLAVAVAVVKDDAGDVECGCEQDGEHQSMYDAGGHKARPDNVMMRAAIPAR